MELKIEIKNIKNIKNLNFTFDFENGIYAIVGENAVGKSTLMSALASTVYPSTLLKLGKTELYSDSMVKVSCLGKSDEWYYSSAQEKLRSQTDDIKFDGIYEGSIFSGTRFKDMSNLDSIVESNPDFFSSLIPAFPELKEAMSFILKNKKFQYGNIFRLRNMTIAKNYNLNNMPYFNKLDSGEFISKYKMSSGECMLLSLLDFINSSQINPLIKHKAKKVIDDRLFIFIDEVELALHPSSILRLIDYLDKLIQTSKLTVVFSSHSTELIKRINPNNIFLLENDNGNASIINPCYPQYAIRSVYDHDGNDCTILVEDILAQEIVQVCIEEFRIKNNLLINILPVGGWLSTLSLQKNIVNNNVIGKDKFMFSILDGDIEQQANAIGEHQHLQKLFLPIMSLEKYMLEKCLIKRDQNFIRQVGNKIFTLESLDKIINDYQYNSNDTKDECGKKFYGHLCGKVTSLGFGEKRFAAVLCGIIMDFEDFSPLKDKIENFIYRNYEIPVRKKL
ncbi:MAG: AAA family ATPase [Candidatus Shapirobacteria bacterium]|jgi:energy-coupling factor transporter ATP-binding protein EcfA2|nr:AAA family ATPase [Candidatus Shapirobacteria bacterium]